MHYHRSMTIPMKDLIKRWHWLVQDVSLAMILRVTSYVLVGQAHGDVNVVQHVTTRCVLANDVQGWK
jgi:hypothetical protein